MERLVVEQLIGGPSEQVKDNHTRRHAADYIARRIQKGIGTHLKRNIINPFHLCQSPDSRRPCGNEETMDKSRIYNIYVMNKDETKLSANEYAAVGESREEIIEELLYQLTATLIASPNPVPPISLEWDLSTR